jgi:hypothetical protein
MVRRADDHPGLAPIDHFLVVLRPQDAPMIVSDFKDYALRGRTTRPGLV